MRDNRAANYVPLGAIQTSQVHRRVLNAHPVRTLLRLDLLRALTAKLGPTPNSQRRLRADRAPQVPSPAKKEAIIAKNLGLRNTLPPRVRLLTRNVVMNFEVF